MIPSPRPAFLSAIPGSVRGIVLMVIFAVLISIAHGLVRYLSAEIHPFEIAFFRNVLTFLWVAPLIVRSGRSAWATPRPGLHVVRAILGASAMLLWFLGLSMVPVADATALTFAVVLFTTIGAILVLGERSDPQRWLAVAIGFVGTFIILRPGVQEISPGVLVVMGSTVLWASALLCIKVLSRTDSSVTIVFYVGAFNTPLTLIPAMFVWQWPSLGQLGVLVAIGSLAAIGHLALAQSFREAEATVVMPFDFTRLIWAAVFGFLVFGEFPDLWTWVGGGIIAASAIYLTYHEAQTRKS
jgi:drug/metabolite transporter (DMT)-like permease